MFALQIVYIFNLYANIEAKSHFYILLEPSMYVFVTLIRKLYILGSNYWAKISEII